MKKICCLLLILITSVDLFSQTNTKESNRVSQELYRTALSIPDYGIKKVKAITPAYSYGPAHKSLQKEKYEKLTLREKFTYNMINGEVFSQNCSAIPIDPAESKKIYAKLAPLSFVFGDLGWSESQRKFFSSNRDSVIYLMKECINKTKMIGLNFKTVIYNFKAKEMMPFLINSYAASPNDHDILTLLMLFMKDNNYKPFLSTETFVKLYAPEDNYRSFVTFTPATASYILKFANQFCNDNNIR
ncbi:MAG: hypothetical protein QM726_24255 [Chitinophagaceae bacterium]